MSFWKSLFGIADTSAVETPPSEDPVRWYTRAEIYAFWERIIAENARAHGLSEEAIQGQRAAYGIRGFDSDSPLPLPPDPQVIEKIAMQQLCLEELRPVVQALIQNIPAVSIDPHDIPKSWASKEHYELSAQRGVHQHADYVVSILKPFVEYIPRASNTGQFVATIGDALPLEIVVTVMKAAQAQRPNFRLPLDIDVNAKRLGLDEFYRDPLSLLRHSHLKTKDFFANTTLEPLVAMPIPVSLPNQDRFSHTHVVGPTGSGKTTLLQNLIAHDLATDATVIVLEPHKALVPTLFKLDVGRKVVLIDPTNPPGLNIFDVRQTDDEIEREKAFARVVKMFSYLFSDNETPLTGKQSDALAALCRLILAFPQTRGRNGTMMDLFEFLESPAGFEREIASLDVLDRSFFKDFTAKTVEYRGTAEQIKYRVRGILQKAGLRKMFTAPHSELDLFQEMEDGSLILIDADQNYLENDTAAFGKIFLSLIMRAARDRGADTKSRPVFLYVDEAHQFFDEQINDILIDARKYRVGCILAHQHLGQKGLTPEIRGALKGTAIKFAGGVHAEDAAALAADMRTTKEFLLSLPPHNFALYARTNRATVSIQPNPNPLSSFQRIERHKPARTPPPLSPPPSIPDEDVSDEW